MPLHLPRAEQAKTIAFIEEILRQFLFHGVSDAMRQQLFAHVEWMRQQTEPLNAHCKLETDHRSLSTTITITIAFGDRAKANGRTGSLS